MDNWQLKLYMQDTKTKQKKLVVCLSTNGERACLVRLHKTTIVLYDVFYQEMLLFHGNKNGFYIYIQQGARDYLFQLSQWEQSPP